MKSMISHQARRLVVRPSSPAIAVRIAASAPTSWATAGRRPFHASVPKRVVKPYLLADIGEGITEVQIIQWFVQPGARVEQFDKICEVQSDKATVEITSRFDGIIKKLYYDADDTARVGKPLVDIDIKSEISPEDEALTRAPTEQLSANGEVAPLALAQQQPHIAPSASQSISPPPPSPASGKHATLATPAVRHLIKEFNLEITQIKGTGKDGRVLKEDVQRFAAAREAGPAVDASSTSTSSTPIFVPVPQTAVDDQTVPLTPVQTQMFKAMTRSLSIPHFLYSDGVDFSTLNRVRQKINATAAAITPPGSAPQKLSALPFILKAVSLALQRFPLINSHLDTASNTSKPQLIYKASHNIAIAIDTPQGLVVPVIRAVQNHSILSLAAEIQRLSQLARTNKLSPADFTDATFTVSNIGSIGGGVAAPIIVAPTVAIVAVGKAKSRSAFNDKGEVVSKEEAVFSWSADHRVVDGAMVARCAETVRVYLEDIESMLVNLK